MSVTGRQKFLSSTKRQTRISVTGRHKFLSPTKRQTRMSVLLARVCFLVLIAIVAAPAAAQSVWELTPYRIRLFAAMQDSPELGPEARAEIARGLLTRCETAIGAAWDVSIGEISPRLRNRMSVDSLAAITADLLPQDSDSFDKIMLVAVGVSPGGYLVSAREFDVRTQVFGPIVEMPAAQASKIGDAAFAAIWRAFSPLALVAESKSKEATLRLRAGNLPLRDKTLAPVHKGDVFQAVVRYLDREGKLRRAVEVPWTFLLVEKIEPRGMHCSVHSAMIGALSGRRRGRVELLALAVRPGNDSTRLLLKARTEPHQPLSGYDVSARLPGETKTTPLGRTGADGSLRIAAVEQSPLLVLDVKCGGAILARLPMVPGLTAVLEAEVPSVDQHLEVEGFITGMQEELIDLVTRREVLIARTKKHIEAAEWDEARAAVNELRSLQTRAELLRILDRRQETVAVKDTWTKKKIETLFADTRTLLNKFLDPESIEQVATELAEAREQSRGKAAEEAIEEKE